MGGIVRLCDERLTIQRELTPGGGFNTSGASVGVPVVSGGFFMRPVIRWISPVTDAVTYENRNMQAGPRWFEGVLRTQLLPECGLLLEGATERTDDKADTFAMHYETPAGDFEYKGVGINVAVLSASIAPETPEVMAAFRFLALTGGTASTMSAASCGTSVPFTWCQSALTVGASVGNAESWQLVYNNHLKPGYPVAGGTSSSMTAGIQDVALTVQGWQEDAEKMNLAIMGNDVDCRLRLTHTATTAGGAITFAAPTAKLSEIQPSVEAEPPGREQYVLTAQRGGTGGQASLTIGNL